MLDALERRSAHPRFWLRYALRRLLRIYPMYLLALLACLGLHRGGLESLIPSWSDLVNHLSLRDARGVFWTLPVEITYYLLSPVVVVLLWPIYRSRPWLAISVLFTAMVSLWFMRFLHLPLPIALRFAPVLGFGTLLAFLQRRLSLPGGLGLALFALILTTIPSVSRQLYGTYPFYGYPYTLAYGLAWMLILYQALYHEVALSALGRWLPLRYLGALSFSIYLLHLPVLALCQHFLDSAWVVPGFWVGTLALSFATYTFVERPLGLLKIRL
jgi:peptidoglycan/LPS O-acetylase OafA/YrhL